MRIVFPDLALLFPPGLQPASKAVQATRHTAAHLLLLMLLPLLKTHATQYTAGYAIQTVS